MLNRLTSVILALLFYRSPLLIFSHEEVEEYEKIYSDAVFNKTEIIYSSRYPKYRFIQYIASTKSVVMHGSNNKGILEFETRRQTLFNGQYVEAVFATRDGIWALFYAVFDRKKLVNNFRNACLRVTGLTSKYYFFSLTRETMDANPWISGMLYFLPQEPFTNVSNSMVSFDEWISKTSIIPLTKIEVEPHDFYFMDKVSCHEAHESIIKSWLSYKLRINMLRKKFMS